MGSQNSTFRQWCREFDEFAEFSPYGTWPKQNLSDHPDVWFFKELGQEGLISLADYLHRDLGPRAAANLQHGYCHIFSIALTFLERYPNVSIEEIESWIALNT
jgi:hypothetical protein